MNYYEQFYDDLEFCEEEDSSYNEQHYGYHDSWTHRDEMYRPPRRGHERGNCFRNYERPGNFNSAYNREYREPSRWQGTQDSNREYRDDWEPSRWQGTQDSNREYRDDWEPSRWQGIQDSNREYRDDWEQRRWRGNQDRGRGPRNRGRGFNERGRGHFGRGLPEHKRGGGQRGNFRGIPKMNFVKASESTELVATEVRTNFENDRNLEDKQAITTPSLPVLPSYGYGPGSDFQEFGGASTESHNFDPGVPGEEAPSIQQSETQVNSQSTPSTTETPDVAQTGASKVVTAVVKPMYHFVKAQSEFRSTDVAFHEKSGKPDTIQQSQHHPGMGMPVGQRVSLQSFDVGTAFHANAKEGCNPAFDAKFERLREAVKLCSLPQKNAIEIIHMAVDKIKMKISDINNPSGRSNSGQAKFMCRLEIDGVHIASGYATNKKSAKHEAYTNAKSLLDGGPLTVKETTPGVFELKQKETLPVAQNVITSQGGPAQSTAPGKVYPPNTACSTPQIVFHKAGQPVGDRPHGCGSSTPGASQQLPQVSSSPGELAMKLLNFVKEGTSTDNPQKAEPSQTPGHPKPSEVPGPSHSFRTNSPNTNMLKRALNSANAGNERAKKVRRGPLSLEDLSQFVIIDNSLMHPNLSDISILHASANHNKVVLKFEYELVKEGYMCSTVLGVHLVSQCRGVTKEESKLAAAKEALDYLQQICYTIVVKQEVDNDMDGFTKSELLSENKQSEVIPDSNIGNMMLRKMGWVGGGVGKDGKGIAEPVKTEMVIGREGLGLKAKQGIGKDFAKNVRTMLTEYIKSDEQQDLHFSCELEKEERAVIHQVGQKLGLKTQSRGKGEDRYLIISRKRSVGQLLDHIFSCGGSTDKYEVLPPANSDSDPRRREAVTYGHYKQ